MDKSTAQQSVKMVYITIGIENSRIPMANKIRTIVFEDETEIQVAKKIRKQFAENAENHGWVKGTIFNPSKLFYAIFDNIGDKTPRLHSANFVSDYIDNNLWSENE